MIELTAPPGTLVWFRGTLIVRGRDPAATAALLDKAVKLIPAIGALKSVGFGEVAGAAAELRRETISDLAPPKADAAPRGADLDRPVCLRVTFDRRLLVDADRAADNVFSGSAVIPGAVFKGALARRLALAGETPEDSEREPGKTLAAMRFGHAFPENDQGQVADGILPLSLLSWDGADGRQLFGDALLVPPDQTPMGRTGPADAPALAAPAYPVDWKGGWFADARMQVGLAKFDDPALLARAHVKIGTDYVADEGKLYVDLGRSPWIDAAAKRRRGWVLTLSRGALADGADLDWYHWLVAALAPGQVLDGIGKTNATARFEPSSLSSPAVKPVGSAGIQARHWAVMLRTPTLMLDPFGLLAQTPAPAAGDGPVPAGADPALFGQYAAYWRRATADQARLVSFYAAQRLAGGYIAVRHRMYGAKTYYPFLLTEPGSVFLLAETEPAGAAGLAPCLDRLRLTGLPATAPASGTAPTWRTCPYLPGNGYGDFVVNAVDHAALAKEVAGV